MRRSLLLGLVAVILLAGLGVLYLILGGKGTASPPEALSALKMAGSARPVPAIRFEDAAGREYSLKNYRGRYVLLNLWASWCAPCVHELPALAGLQRAIAPKRLAIVTVDVEKDAKDKAAKFLIAHDAADLPAFADPDLKAMQALKVFGLPTTLLIGPDGREIGRAIGPAHWDDRQAVAWFDALTAKKKTAVNAKS